MIFGVLGEIAMGARVGDLLDDPRPLDLLAVLEFDFERRIPVCRHRNLIYHARSSNTRRVKKSGREPRHRLAARQEKLALHGPSLGPPRDLIRPGPEIALQRTHLKVAPEISPDALRRGDGPRESGVVRHFMQEGGAA